MDFNTTGHKQRKGGRPGRSGVAGLRGVRGGGVGRGRLCPSPRVQDESRRKPKKEKASGWERENAYTCGYTRVHMYTHT